uniref:Uncharacterized protein TCIL3000_9_5440 n=1 Tax=Trypanosoma congolense (strain IL3000) TaxID=1068625 RepID=G0UUS2_TRYCI|nr:unnamed protein product [Trypanosoma congolense IL3000]
MSLSRILCHVSGTFIVTAAAFVVHVCIPRFTPGLLKTLCPTLLWGFTCVCTRSAFGKGLTVVLFIHVVVAVLLLLGIGTSNRVVNRVMLLPVVVSVLAALYDNRLPKLSIDRAVGVTLIYLWSAFSALVLLAVFPASILGGGRDQQREHEERFSNFVNAATEYKMERFSVSSRGGVTLDVVVFLQNNATDRWIAYFGGNAETLESSSEELVPAVDLVRANWIFHNPRGVGRSNGYVCWTNDLVDDAEAVVMEAMRRYALRPEKLLLWGHSIGGGVAALLAHRRPEKAFPILLDRTFSRLSDAAIPFSPFRPVGTKRMIWGTVGDMEVVESLRVLSSNMLIVYHRKDEIIRYNISSIARPEEFAKTGLNESVLLELRSTYVASPHSTPLHYFPEAELIHQRINALYA